ncbi:hypothetical protein [Shinella zoogloeoides]|uniref:hypothetical protein n=1 Tax=Shinella zoogloeoides TaxID=352475 RepID=UPI00273FF606|nr:hypothetical protein [Shinella zoogloeoides]WLR94421.1 hypothetical protein Q9316_09720 [Shinella zoogloeoides]
MLESRPPAEGAEMTSGLKALVFSIFVSMIGVVVGIAGLLMNWPLAKQIGLGSGLFLGVVLTVTGEASTKQLNRFLFGRPKKD